MRRWLRKIRGAPKTLQERYPEYEIGRGSYGGLTVRTFGNDGTLRVGRYCSFAGGVQIMLGGNHRLDFATTYPFNALQAEFAHITGHPASRGDVVIGNDVWVAREAMILSGVRIGDGAVIGARAVVTRDVAPYSIVAGNPGQHVRNRFAPDIAARFAAIAWWNWDEDRVRRAVPALMSADVTGFLTQVETGAL